MSEHKDLPRVDEEYYQLATVEFERGWKDDAIWAKAMAVCEGAEQRARYRYIRLRAQQFMAAERQQAESAATPVNRLHAAVQIRVEHIIRSLKRFRILAGRYRNRRRRFALRFNLIAAIHNFESNLAS